MREKSLCSGPNRANCSIVNGEIPEPSKKLSIWLYNSIILIADFCFFFYRLVETARLLRNVRNVFRRPNVTSDGARGQTELELSRKICWYSLFKTHLKQETVNKDHFTSMSLLFCLVSFQMDTLSHKKSTALYGKGTWFERTTPLCLRGLWISCKSVERKANICETKKNRFSRPISPRPTPSGTSANKWK